MNRLSVHRVFEISLLESQVYWRNRKRRRLSGRFQTLIWRPGETVRNLESPGSFGRVNVTAWATLHFGTGKINALWLPWGMGGCSCQELTDASHYWLPETNGLFHFSSASRLAPMDRAAKIHQCYLEITNQYNETCFNITWTNFVRSQSLIFLKCILAFVIMVYKLWHLSTVKQACVCVQCIS